MAEDKKPAEPQDLGDLLLQAIRTGSRRGGPFHATITGWDGLVFSGGFDLGVVAQVFLNSVQKLPLAADFPDPKSTEHKTDSDVLRMIDDAVRALGALGKG